MFGTLRSLMTVAICGGLLWGAFTVKLGRKTLAEHVDSISETKEAQDLIQGTRKTVNPVLEDAKERVLGEYVEAPTVVVGETGGDLLGSLPEKPLEQKRAHASSSAEQAKLPGQR